MNKLLHEFQSRFGQINKEKVFARLVTILIPLIAATAVGVAFYNASDMWRLIMIIGMAVATALYTFIYLRKKSRSIIAAPKIPINQEKRETYVEADKPNTAPIPIIAERSPYEIRQTQSRSAAPSPIQTVELSNFAKRRIAQKLPELKGNKAVFEARKSVLELLLQLEKRQPTGATKRRFGSKDKERNVLEPRSTIYGELLFVAFSIFILLLPVLQNLVTSPEWVTTTANKLNDSPSFLLVFLIVSGLLLIVSLLLLYRKWAYWYYWRLVLFDADPSRSSQARLVIIDMPFLMPGGTTPSVFLHVVRIATSATFKTKSEQASNRKEQRSFRSILAGTLGVSWLIVDTFGDKDEPFNWMGPFRKTEQLETKINMLIADNYPTER
jgi:hypothetical protein